MPVRKLGSLLGLCLWLAVVASHGAISSEARLSPPGDVRQFLTAEVLSGEKGDEPEDIHYAHFMPVGEAGPAKHAFSGRLTLSSFPIDEAEGTRARHRRREESARLFGRLLLARRPLGAGRPRPDP